VSFLSFNDQAASLLDKIRTIDVSVATNEANSRAALTIEDQTRQESRP
jgi:hypothetical protein